MTQHHSDHSEARAGVDRRTLLAHGAAIVGGATGAAMLSHTGVAAADTTTVRPTSIVTTLTGAAIQAAVNALPACGGIIELVAGTYSITTPIVLRSWCQLVGAGHATVLRIANGSNAAGVIRNADTTNGNVDIAVRSLKIDGNKGAQTATRNRNGIELHRCADFLLDDIEVAFCDGMGVLVSGDGAVTRIGKINNVWSHDNATNGLEVTWAMREVTYTSVTCDLNGQDGLVMDHSETIASGIHCSRNGRDGLLITNVVDNNVVGVTADLNGRTGIRVNGFMNSLGASWSAHNNGQKQAGADVHFDGTLRTYGPTNHATVSGIECGLMTKSTWGDPYGGAGKATETYGVIVDPSVTGNLTLIGVRNTGGKLGKFSIAGTGATGNLVIIDQPADTPELRVLRGNLHVAGGNITHDGSGKLGFFGAGATTKPAVTGKKGTTQPVAVSLLAALVKLGLVKDSTS